MGSINKVVFVALGMSITGCSVESGGGDSVLQGVNPNDVKPEDGAELAPNIGTAREAHAQHYVDGTSLQDEKAYPMNTPNPNCMDWWVYDRYLPLAPPKGVWSYYSTYQTSHPASKGQAIQDWLNTIPTDLGWNTNSLLDHNSVVDRSRTSKAGKCTGRYVFQWDNHDTYGTNNFLGNQYWMQAKIPQNLIPSSNDKACKQTAATSVPSAWVDLYVCESARTIDIRSVSAWCAVGSGHWRYFGGAPAVPTYYAAQKKCDTTASYYYTPPPYTAAVSFNLVVKTGVGHGVAPAEISIFRVN